MSSYRPLFLAVSLAVIACTDSTDDNDTAADPPTGVWMYMDGGIQQNTCGTDSVYTDPDTSFVLTNNGDETFTIAQGAEEDFVCTISGNAFDCPKRLQRQMPIEMTDAIVKWQVSITGTFSSDTQMSGTQRADIECTGTQCNLVAAAVGATVPCYYTVAFTARAQ